MSHFQQTNDEDAEEKKVDKSNKNEKDALHLGIHSTDDRMKISVIPPTLKKGLKRLPVIIACVVDTSGSMGCDAIIKDEKGKEESHGLSILDLVKHSIKTIIECLHKDDYLSIISYNNEAKVITNLIKMNKKNKKKTLNSLKELQADGQTNLWHGLFNGLEQLRKCKQMENAYHNSSIMLFTDGLPNIIPPKGHMAMLNDYIAQYPLNTVINTYGFGYQLDTKLLTQLAIHGNGNYSFIPDSTMVGTIFVNSLSNFCCNVAKNVILKVDIKEAQVIGGYPHVKTPKGYDINLGNVMYGQNKDVMIQCNPKTIHNISLNYISLRHNKCIECIEYDDIGNKRETEMIYYRLHSCDILRECMELKDIKNAESKLKELIKRMEANALINSEKYIVDLLKDLRGQCFEAISKEEYYAKWGKHYLPSLIFAHLNQNCNNFKDPGVQHYGGALFNQLRDKANDIFIKMAAPKPSYKPPDWLKEFGDINVAAAPAPNVAMSSYMNASGGCFEGDCTVLMDNGSLKYVKDLMFGDIVKNGAMVKCVIKYECKDNKAMLTTLNKYNNLKITPFHPIKMNGEWIFPISANDGCVWTKEEECDYVFNVVLSDDHVLVVNGIECCSLGHNFMQNEVIKHPYFGTNKVINDLKGCNGWRNGEVILEYDAFERDEDSGLVCGIKQN